MATTKAPLFSLGASGTVGKSIVYSNWRGRSYVRMHAVPSNPRTGLQVGMRSVFKWITQAFADLSGPQLAGWANRALSDNITALNAQVRDAGKRARDNLGWRAGLEETPVGTIDAPTGLDAVPMLRSAVLSWARPVANQGGYCTAIYQTATINGAADISNLVAVVPVGTLTATITNLTSGVEVFFRCRELSAAGELGTLSTGAAVTPN